MCPRVLISMVYPRLAAYPKPTITVDQKILTRTEYWRNFLKDKFCRLSITITNSEAPVIMRLTNKRRRGLSNFDFERRIFRSFRKFGNFLPSSHFWNKRLRARLNQNNSANTAATTDNKIICQTKSSCILSDTKAKPKTTGSPANSRNKKDRVKKRKGEAVSSVRRLIISKSMAM